MNQNNINKMPGERIDAYNAVHPDSRLAVLPGTTLVRRAFRLAPVIQEFRYV